MSGVDTTFRDVWHPWRALAQRPDISLDWKRLPGLLGCWCQRTSTITLHPDQNQAERRCTLTHELLHAERGDTTCDWRTHRDAARLLIPLVSLVREMLAHGEDWPVVAEALWVDEDTLAARLQHLHPSELGYLHRHLSMRESSA